MLVLRHHACVQAWHYAFCKQAAEIIHRYADTQLSSECLRTGNALRF